MTTDDHAPIEVGAYAAAVQQIADLHRLHARHLQDAARQIHEYRKDRDLIVEEKQAAEDQLARIRQIISEPGRYLDRGLAAIEMVLNDRRGPRWQ